MRTSIIVIGLALSGAAAPAAAHYVGDGYRGGYDGGYDGDYRGGEIVRCESNDGRTRECPTSGGRVVVERQLSRGACIEGVNWGYGRTGIWVSQGCRADFRVLGWARPGGPGYGGIVRCESNDGRYRRCALPERGRAQLVRQLSRSACIEGRTWGSEYGSVWVSQGCRAEFAVTRRPGRGWGAYGQGMGGRVFRCESNDGRYVECAANTRGGVVLVKQLSRAACIEGRTWGYARSGIWVSQGCRAEFRSD